MTRRQTAVVLVGMLGLLALAPAPGLAQLILPNLQNYDTFTASSLGTKWRGTEGEPPVVEPLAKTGFNTDAERRVVGGELRLRLTTYGGTGSTSGSANGTNYLRIHQANLTDDRPRLLAMQAKITVLNASLTSCAGNAALSRVRAGILAYFFNRLASGDGRTGEVGMNIQLMNDAQVGRRIEVDLIDCTNADCSTFTTRGTTALLNTTWTENVPLFITVHWDRANDRFVFTVSSKANPTPNPPDPEAEQHIIDYTTLAQPVTEVRRTQSFSKALRIYNSAHNCQAGRKRASMTAHFDSVRIATE
jgi:hypothetical protein